MSYYAQWSDLPLERLGEVLKRLEADYGKGIAVVETAYAWKFERNDDANSILGEQSLEPGYPRTKAGQRRYLIDLMSSVLESGGLGIIYWEHAWISTRCQTRWGRGSHWENAALFEFKRSELHEGEDFLSHEFADQ